MSDAERALETRMKQEGLPEPRQQYKFHPKRKWLADFCFPAQKIIVEVQGGTWIGGRHTQGQGYENDCERLNAAQLCGWTVLYVTPKMIADGRAVATIKKALGVE